MQQLSGVCIVLAALSCSANFIHAAPAANIGGQSENTPKSVFDGGCVYLSQYYEDGEPVPTSETCLNCTCHQGALRCHLQVCPYRHQLNPPPAGCILVERKNACCPKLHCPKASDSGRRKDPSGKIDALRTRQDLQRRLAKHFSEITSAKRGCIEGGTLYAEGSAMMTSTSCEYCYCLKGKETCVKPRCREPVDPGDLEGCTPRYQRLACCPTHYQCAITTANGTQHVTKMASSITGASLRSPSPASSKVIHSSRLSPIDLTINLNGQKADVHVINKRETAHEQRSGHQLQKFTDEDAVTEVSLFDALTEATLLYDDVTDVTDVTDTVDGLAVTTEELAPEVTEVTEVTVSVSSSTTSVSSTVSSSSTSALDETPEEKTSMTSSMETDTAANQETTTKPSVTSSVGLVDPSDDQEVTTVKPPNFIGTTLKRPSTSAVITGTSVANQEAPRVTMTSSVTLESVDYDYDNMELPPSLPNLEIIPFVAADAVIGFKPMDDDVDDDQRLKVFTGKNEEDDVEQMTPQPPPPPPPPSVPKKSIAEEDKAEEIRPESSVSATPAAPAAAANQTSTPATPLFPIQAFRVTFPPRRSTTVAFLPASLRPKPTPPTSPSAPRFSVKKPATKPPPRKSQQPSTNNFIRAGGLQIDSCNIYGQMYQVGRIIEELSDVCIECKCTEIGVACTNLKC